jgi:hypothetical protein
LKILNQPLAFSVCRLPTRRLEITDQFDQKMIAEVAVSADTAMEGERLSQVAMR